MIDKYKTIIKSAYNEGKCRGDSIDAIMHKIISQIPVHVLPVGDKVMVSQTILST